MDTLLGFLLEHADFLLGLVIGTLLGAVLMIALTRLIWITNDTLRIAEANTLDTPHYGPPDAPRSRVPRRNPMITGELRKWEGRTRGSNPPAPGHRPPPPEPPPPPPPRKLRWP